jgi:ADP-heptose:LPS heptosyltransferase
MIDGKIAVHLRAPVTSASGYGTHSRQVIDYLLSDERFIVFLENVGWGGTPSIHEGDLQNRDKMSQYYGCMANYEKAIKSKIPFDISIQVTIPNEFSRRAQLNIGVTAGIEVNHCTAEWIHKCNDMDLIVVPSIFSRDILASTVYEARRSDGSVSPLRIEKNIVVIPEWFDRPSEIKPLNIDFSTSQNLLFVGLWGNKGGIGEDRKDIGTLVTYFLKHFGKNEDVGLILKTCVMTNSAEDLIHTKEKIKKIKDQFPGAKCKIHLIHEFLSESEMWSLYSHPKVTAMVSLTHGEGFGLPLLDAAASGLPVIATNWSGHLDFLKEKNGFLPLDFSMRQVPESQVWDGVINKEATWAYIEEDSFEDRAKKIFKSSFVPKKAAKAHVKFLDENFSKEAVLGKWKQFFDQILMSEKGDQRQRTGIPEIDREIDYQANISAIASDIEKTLNLPQRREGVERVCYIMPRSFGDVVISTSIMNSLISNRHLHDEFYFLTDPMYSELADGLCEKFSNFKVLKWDERLIQSEVSRKVFDVVYNPTVNVQYILSNWTNGNGLYGVRLLEEFAKSCNLGPVELVPTYCVKPKETSLPTKKYVAITAVQKKQAKEYSRWEDVVFNLRNMADIEVVQIGEKSEKLIEGCIDMRGKTFNETLFIVQNALLHISPDTGTAHCCAALHVPHIVLFATTDPYQCCPMLFNADVPQVVIVSADAPEVKYRDIDTNIVDGKNSLSRIDSSTICEFAFKILSGQQLEQEEADDEDDGS